MIYVLAAIGVATIAGWIVMGAFIKALVDVALEDLDDEP